MELEIKCPKCGSQDVEATNHYEDWILECNECRYVEVQNTEEWLEQLFPDWFK